jgi:hypothetical protein
MPDKRYKPLTAADVSTLLTVHLVSGSEPDFNWPHDLTVTESRRDGFTLRNETTGQRFNVTVEVIP